jgi:hypothetical protein
MLSLGFAHDSFVRLTEMMARCSPLGEVAATNVAEAKNVGGCINCDGGGAHRGGDEMHVVSSDEGHASSGYGNFDSVDEKASDNENSHTYNFGASTITLGHIKEMEEKGYFVNGEARAPGAETMPEPDDDEAIMYEDFFCCRPAHASTSCFGEHFVEISSAAPSTNTECNSVALKVFLGCWQLQRRGFGRCICEKVRAPLSAENGRNLRRHSVCAVWLSKLSC